MKQIRAPLDTRSLIIAHFLLPVQRFQVQGK
jgi:hypothetical protein